MIMHATPSHNITCVCVCVYVSAVALLCAGWEDAYHLHHDGRQVQLRVQQLRQDTNGGNVHKASGGNCVVMAVYYGRVL